MSFLSAIGGGGVDASGGDNVFDITDNGVNYRVHEFTSVGTSSFVVNSGGEVEYLVIAGGGGGGNNGTTYAGGGGGAGGYRCSVSGENSGGGANAEPPLSVSPGSFTVTVGSGGSVDADGQDSVFGPITSIGGGAGGGGEFGDAGNVGGSAGGAGGNWSNTAFSEGTADQGFAGGSGVNAVP
jgi:hypothetical protein